MFFLFCGRCENIVFDSLQLLCLQFIILFRSHEVCQVFCTKSEYFEYFFRPVKLLAAMRAGDGSSEFPGYNHAIYQNHRAFMNTLQVLLGFCSDTDDVGVICSIRRNVLLQVIFSVNRNLISSDALIRRLADDILVDRRFFPAIYIIT